MTADVELGPPYLLRSRKAVRARAYQILLMDPGSGTKTREIALMRIFLMFLALTATGWAQESVRIGKIEWFTDYDVALRQSRRSGKPLWLHFGENPG